jgi:site-specific DNA-cytosine methylase
MKRVIKAVDMYCGGGGSSTGLLEACQELGFAVDLVAEAVQQ